MSTLHTMGVLLAAGGGTRFRSPDGSHKLLADLHGIPLWRHSLDHLLAAELEHNVVVTGSATLRGLSDTKAQVVHNEGWASGQASSLQLAVAAARAAEVEAIVVGLADQPFVPAQAWRAVSDAPSHCPLVVATYAGQWGPNPVRIARGLWSELPTEGDEGARSLLRKLRDDVCTVACVGSPADIDTPEDLALWTSS